MCGRRDTAERSIRMLPARSLTAARARARRPRGPDETGETVPTTTPTQPAPQIAATRHPDARCIGRERLLDRVERYLAQHRPVTLRGAPGVGKTRLLEELGGRHLGPVHRVGAAQEGATVPCVRDVPDGMQPLLVLVDDAQRLARLEVARLHALQAQPWCRVVAAVDSHAGPDDRLGSWWQGAPWQRIEVVPLDRRATAALLVRLLGGLAEPRLVHEVWRITGGNPVAITMLIADAQATGGVGPGADSWRLVAPLPLRRLSAPITARLEGLSDVARRDLAILSVASPLPVRAAASLLDPRAARELEAGGLACYRESAQGRTLAIVDPVHAEVVRAGMLPGERREVLGTLAAAFDRLDVTGRRRLELARWRLEIGGWSSLQLSAASVLAHGAGDPGLAGDLAAAALDADSGDSSAAASARRMAALSTVERCAGAPVDPATGRSPCEVVDVADDGWAGTALHARVRAQVLAVGTGRWSEAAAQLVDLDATDPDPARRAHAGLLLALGGDVTGARVVLGDTVDAHEQPPSVGADGDPAGVATAVLAAVAAAVVGLWSGDSAQVQSAHEAVASLLPQLGTETIVPTAEHLLAGAHLLSDVDRPLRERIAEASDEVDGSLRSFGAETAWWYAVEGWLRWQAGDLATARDRLVAATLACRSADPIRLRAVLVADLAVLAGLSGAAVEAEWRLGQVGTDRSSNRAVAHRCALAELLVRHTRRGADDLGPALLALADRAAEEGRTRDAVQTWHLVARLGGAAADAGRAEAGLVAHRRAAVSDGVRAHVAAWSGQDAAALEEAARILAAQGRTLAAAEAAFQAFQLGGGERAGALAGALRAACGEVLTPALEGCAPVELSPRRRAAAVLAMAGLDGRTIATRLGVSVRTVENHLARVYRQVGVRGRSELGELFTAGVAPFVGTAPTE